MFVRVRPVMLDQQLRISGFLLSKITLDGGPWLIESLLGGPRNENIGNPLLLVKVNVYSAALAFAFFLHPAVICSSHHG